MTADPTLDATGDGVAPRAPDAAGLMQIALLLPPAIVLLVVGLLTPTADLFPHQGDVELYLRRGAAFADGAVPYREFPFEYPPFALISMVVPYVLSPVGPPDLDAYRWLFLAWQAGLLVVLGLVLRRLARLGAYDGGAAVVAARLTLLTVAAALPLAWRYDLLPAVFAAAAVLVAVEGRLAAAGVAVGIGVLAKLFPVVVLPAIAARSLAARDTESVARIVLATGAVVLIGLAPFVAAAGPDALDFLGYQLGRGLQLESLGGGLTMLVGALSGRPVELDYGFAAVHVTGPFAEGWLAVLPLITAVGFGIVAVVTWWSVRAAARARLEVHAVVVVSLAAAWILALLVTSKVLSVQYVVWLVPFAALLPRPTFWLAVAACGLSLAIHPWQYQRLIAGDLGPILLLNVRNSLLVMLLAGVLVDLLRRARNDAHGVRPTRVTVRKGE